MISWQKSPHANVWNGYVGDTVQFTISQYTDEEIAQDGAPPFQLDRRIGNFTFGNEVECQTLEECKALADEALRKGNLHAVDLTAPLATKTSMTSIVRNREE